eukprot:CAMPEP_0184688080 /NCGR_PEP_ID=MMETSP0312-20130426/28480_1 /TAXON_ID=31354 /ORGANISM="Compsopogon coeruleus, Strain SAG 36.94" /LENGTH=336 /DNA_ID=CAMNT_0027144833 /DNA_START=199 /DNA_END=1209 /DNA_ORIENTATION=-
MRSRACNASAPGGGTTWAKARLTVDGIADSPVFQSAGLDRTSVDVAEWERLAEAALDKAPKGLSLDVIVTYYLPIFFWIENLLEATKENRAGQKALAVGLSCPQGGGKTTMTRVLEHLFELKEQTCVIASTDDFYLTHSEQQELASKHSGNRLLELRGNPGSMDVKLMESTLRHLVSLPSGSSCRVPRYDKSAFQGKGDRCPEEKWAEAVGPIDVVLLEGWCMGFKSCGANALSLPELAPVDEYLRGFESIYQMLDALVVVQVEDYRVVYKWREEAEEKMRMEGKPGMSASELRDFVERFLPSYQQYLPGLYSSPVLASGQELRLKISPKRRPVRI